MSELIEVITTFGSPSDARRIAADLIERSLAACVQIGGPVESWYRWDGKIEEAEEWTCSIKTTKAKFADVEALLKAIHPYDEPQIIAVEIVQTSDSYGQWYRDQLGQQGNL